jgi:predicted anti-sigma-YlaC factor YlaD
MGGELQDRCARAREWVSLRADGELSELERLLLRRHLGRCDGCRAFAESIGSTTAILRATALEAPSRSLAPDLPAARAPRAGRRRLALATALVCLGALAGGLVGGLVVGGGEAPSPGPVPDIARIDTEPNVTPDRPPVTSVEPPGEPV